MRILGTYEITRELLRSQLLTDKFDMIDTAISYDNDLLLRGLITSYDKASHPLVMSKIQPYMVDQYDWLMGHHITNLGVDRIEYMLIHSSEGDWKTLGDKMVNDDKIKYIGVSNFNIEEMMEFEDYFGFPPAINEVEINPEYTPVDTLQYCIERGIDTVAYAILGGKYNARKYISQYTLTGLIGHAKTYSTHQILRADTSLQMEELLESYDYDHRVDDFPIKTKKSIEPFSYEPPLYISSVRGMYDPTTVAIIENKNLPYGEEFDMSSNRIYSLLPKKIPKFRFLTDYQVYIRYLFDEDHYPLDPSWIHPSKVWVDTVTPKGEFTKAPIKGDWVRIMIIGDYPCQYSMEI